MSDSHIVIGDTSYGVGRISRSAASGTELPAPMPTRGKRVSANKLTAEIVADLIIEFCHEHGDLITNLRLQKLLYYAQAWHLAMHEKPLFLDRIEAWGNGPIQPDVYAKFARFGHQQLDHETSDWKVAKHVSNHIADLMRAYGHLSSFDLEMVSRDEEPWKAARNRITETDKTPEVSRDLMMRFYKLRLNSK